MTILKQYRAVFKATKPGVKGKRPILLISVGQEYHEGPKLDAAIDLLNRSGFDHCTVMLACTLQRHNLLHTCSEFEAELLAKKMGDEWLERNASRLERLTIPCKVIRWQENFTYEPEFSKIQAKFQKALLA